MWPISGIFGTPGLPSTGTTGTAQANHANLTTTGGGNWTIAYPPYQQMGAYGTAYPYVAPTILLRCAENLFAVNVVNGSVKKQDRGTLALDTAYAWEIFSNYWDAWALSVKIRKQNGEKDAK